MMTNFAIWWLMWLTFNLSGWITILRSLFSLLSITNPYHFSQDSLVLEATADGLSGEQTWPTEAEMNMGDSALETMDSAVGRNRRIVPTNVRLKIRCDEISWFMREILIDGRFLKHILLGWYAPLHCSAMCDNILHYTAVETLTNHSFVWCCNSYVIKVFNL